MTGGRREQYHHMIRLYNVPEVTMRAAMLRVRDLYARSLLSAEENTGDGIHFRECESSVAGTNDMCATHRASDRPLSCWCRREDHGYCPLPVSRP